MSFFSSFFYGCVLRGKRGMRFVREAWTQLKCAPFETKDAYPENMTPYSPVMNYARMMLRTLLDLMITFVTMHVVVYNMMDAPLFTNYAPQLFSTHICFMLCTFGCLVLQDVPRFSWNSFFQKNALKSHSKAFFYAGIFQTLLLITFEDMRIIPFIALPLVTMSALLTTLLPRLCVTYIHKTLRPFAKKDQKIHVQSSATHAASFVQKVRHTLHEKTAFLSQYVTQRSKKPAQKIQEPLHVHTPHASLPLVGNISKEKESVGTSSDQMPPSLGAYKIALIAPFSSMLTAYLDEMKTVAFEQMILIVPTVKDYEKLQFYVSMQHIKDLNIVCYHVDSMDHHLLSHILSTHAPHIVLYHPHALWCGEGNRMAFMRSLLLTTECIAYTAQHIAAKACVMSLDIMEPHAGVYHPLLKNLFMRYQGEDTTRYITARYDYIVGSLSETDRMLQNQSRQRDIFPLTYAQYVRTLFEAARDMTYGALEGGDYTVRLPQVMHRGTLHTASQFIDMKYGKKYGTRPVSSHPYLFFDEKMPAINPDTLQFLLQATESCDLEFLERVWAQYTADLSGSSSRRQQAA